MIKIFKQLSSSHSLWEVYSDFLELAAIAISNSCDFRNFRERENQYLSIVKKYTQNEVDLFPKLLGELVMILENKMSDALGEIFMELELENKWKGQFFTQYSVCKLMTKLTGTDIDMYIEQKGYVTLNEPCSGGGAMIIAFAEAMRRLGYNPQKQLMVICQDVDVKSVYMTYIQLSLLGIPAVVYHGDTLSMKMYSEWKTPFYILEQLENKSLINKRMVV